MLIYVQETLATLERLRDYADNLRQKFDLGRDAPELLLDAESLDQRLREIIDCLPAQDMSGNCRSHLSWLVRRLKEGNVRACRQDIEDLADRDIPGTIEKLRQWSMELQHLDGELRAAVTPLIKTMQFDSAIRKSFLVLTERLRAHYDLPNGKDGEDLVNQAFGKDSSFNASLDASRRSALRNYFAGIYGVIRNKFAHGDHEATIAELEAALASVNLGLQILGELKDVE